MDRNFEDALREVRNSEEQRTLESRDVNARFKALGLGLLFGILVLCATASAIGGAGWWITGLLGIMGAGALVAWHRATVQLILLAKEQDRRYFLSCIRKAKSITELNRAGFFAYKQDSNGSAWVDQVKTDVANLREALEVEPEWFEPT